MVSYFLRACRVFKNDLFPERHRDFGDWRVFKKFIAEISGFIFLTRENTTVDLRTRSILEQTHALCWVVSRSHPLRPGLRCHHFTILQGHRRCIRRKYSFPIRFVKFWDRLPISIVIALSVNSFKYFQHGTIWLQRSCDSPPSINKDFPFALYPFTLFPPVIHCHT